jgi:hypothetical protein
MLAKSFVYVIEPQIELLTNISVLMKGDMAERGPLSSVDRHLLLHGTV